jgi:HEAT repeat protein
MTGRRWISLAIAATLGVAVVGSGIFWFLKPAARAGKYGKITTAPAKSPMQILADGLRRSDPQSLNAICQQVLANGDQPKPAVSEAEGADLVEVLDGLRAGFLKFPPVGRASAVSVATHIFDRFRVEPAPNAWFLALRPVHQIVIAGLADPQVDVRASALTEVGQHWGWLPGRTMTPMEEEELAAWKDSFYEPAKRRLSDTEPKSRAAAVVCIGSLPINTMAAPAVSNVEYTEHGGVRYKALMTFANRPELLSVDMILKRLHDSEPGIPELAELILKGRGLSREQIFLGRQITNPHPDVRVSVIPLVRDRTDIDPEIWLLQLSHDPEETVRAKAVEALVDRDSPDVNRRLNEIALGDTSPAIRAAASKHVAKTAALPPLPGSPSLNPKAN